MTRPEQITSDSQPRIFDLEGPMQQRVYEEDGYFILLVDVNDLTPVPELYIAGSRPNSEETIKFIYWTDAEDAFERAEELARISLPPAEILTTLLREFSECILSA